ncbi:MAG: hypothetical protein J07HQX50_00584 [Haloquadratum sp. J07HQX50]|nr:MAG: hypothetical protein J07HQX50_00584 [Haloquadratum sp. J07HQX50]
MNSSRPRKRKVERNARGRGADNPVKPRSLRGTSRSAWSERFEAYCSRWDIALIYSRQSVPAHRVLCGVQRLRPRQTQMNPAAHHGISCEFHQGVPWPSQDNHTRLGVFTPRTTDLFLCGSTATFSPHIFHDGEVRYPVTDGMTVLRAGDDDETAVRLCTHLGDDVNDHGSGDPWNSR